MYGLGVRGCLEVEAQRVAFSVGGPRTGQGRVARRKHRLQLHQGFGSQYSRLREFKLPWRKAGLLKKRRWGRDLGGVDGDGEVADRPARMVVPEGLWFMV